MYYIYILYSISSDIYYIGHSDNPWYRAIQHNTKDHGTFSSKHQPWKLIATFEVDSKRSEALTLERFIKKQKSRKLIERLINPQFIPEGKLAQLVRVPHVRD
ncbi:MAG: GIY-YIG nuclease family protein [Bacteroidetes bacterium]|nr:GIY-YIG nuclease family protein [Bacteroidota bacterium]